MLNLDSIMIGTNNIKGMKEFYEKIFDTKPDMEEGGYIGWKVGNSYFSIGEHSEVKGESNEPARIILNFTSDNFDEDVKKIQEFGAKVIAEPYEIGGGWIATFSDPDGNYFQLMTPWE